MLVNGIGKPCMSRVEQPRCVSTWLAVMHLVIWSISQTFVCLSWLEFRILNHRCWCRVDADNDMIFLLSQEMKYNLWLGTWSTFRGVWLEASCWPNFRFCFFVLIFHLISFTPQCHRMKPVRADGPTGIPYWEFSIAFSDRWSLSDSRTYTSFPAPRSP